MPDTLSPAKAILGDLNPELIATYIEVKYRIDAVLKALLRLKPFDRNQYLQLRKVEPTTMSPPARAARFIYLNRHCFNGIYRTNLQGQFNVPYSGVRCGGFPSRDVFLNCSSRLRQARFVKGDFEKVLQQAQKGDLVYMDPPFAVTARRVFREYDPSTFTTADIARMRSWMERLNAAHINFVVSYAECKLTSYGGISRMRESLSGETSRALRLTAR